jgi:poly(A) polymerase
LKNLINKIIKLSKDYEVYAVGGFARDLLIKRPHTDIDLAVNKTALKYAKLIASALDAKLIVLDDISKTYRLILKNAPIANIDISLMDGKTILEDLKKRDFTINAMAFNISTFANFSSNFIFANDQCLKDLKSKTIKIVSPLSFKQDALRMLRAFRFSAELGFEISSETLKRIKTDAHLISKIAPERIKAEFFRVLKCPKSAPLIRQMYQTN